MSSLIWDMGNSGSQVARPAMKWFLKQCLDGAFGSVGTMIVRWHKLALDVLALQVIDEIKGHGVVRFFV